MLKKRIAFLGAGNMAEAMISGIVESEKLDPSQIVVTNRSNHERLNELKAKYDIQAVTKDQLDYSAIDVFILAMKPKDIESVLEDIKERIEPNQLLISVLAGISTTYMEEMLNDQQQAIRVMPNTSSMLRESATAISPGKHVTMDQVLVAKELMKCIGEAYIIEEDKMDIFTGIAGSGPAYFYNLMEHIEETGKQGGLDRETARSIGAQTILGAAKMILEQEETPTELRENVTSPNGTTAAGLQALDENGGGEAIAAAINGAASRSKEISEELEKKPVLSK
ncbi:pyrroline-5-carboxylate reductase [Alkalihalobacillus sp. AL-G]|uniref:pyrroline-5-carboxylate reductase n=1 Tax=Alkalihalobacillus sp. AL-G TaxID=2926399 RepID=UPI00272BFAF7|nr:pyrroline-5-carboxylate reductase [Alkalihalobacillus sp. AL-G]WLD93776.1 pyrroline-5-carboxylate reductase [Alkalihalobacillus sp. AL-G]